MEEFASGRENDLFRRGKTNDVTEIEIDVQNTLNLEEKPKKSYTYSQTWIAAFTAISLLIVSCIIVASLVISLNSEL